MGIDIYVPWALAQLGRGMLLPVVPLYLRDQGMSYTQVTAVIAALGVGAVLGGLPAGALVGRSGPPALFAGAAAAMAVTTVLLGVSTSVIALAVFRMTYGVGSVGIRIASQIMVAHGAAAHMRGRRMSLLGGVNRMVFFIGPLLGGFLVDTVGYRTTFLASGIATALGMAPTIAAHRRLTTEPKPQARAQDSVLQALRRNRKLVLLAGFGPALVMTVRTGRQVVVPLIGDDLGLTATQVGAIVAVGTGADVLLFPVAGWLMDRFGRLFAIIPAFLLLAVGLLILGVTTTVTGAVVAGVVMGIGNGMSAGTMMTLGADLAPPEPGPFFAALGTMQNLGAVLGPILVGWLADAAGLRTSAVVLAVVMTAAIGWIVLFLGDTANPRRPWLVASLLRNQNHSASAD